MNKIINYPFIDNDIVVNMKELKKVAEHFLLSACIRHHETVFKQLVNK